MQQTLNNPRQINLKENLKIGLALSAPQWIYIPMAPVLFFQNPYKFFPDERFGDESPILALRQVGRCRVNSSPAMDSMFTELEGVVGFHPPLPPPPPPYHPPATPSHAQLKGAWRPRVPMPTPTRSFSYPCNRTLIQRHAAAKHGSSDYSSVPRPVPPDCTNPQAMGRALLSDQQAVSVRVTS